MRIYTKVGDGGNTYLCGGKKIPKNHPRVEAYGAVDELNSALGLAKAFVKSKAIIAKMDEVQKELFVLGSELATEETASKKCGPRITQAYVARLEKEIDRMELKLPRLKNFILPGGSPASAALHLARSLCRRAERASVSLLKRHAISPNAQIYLNRLSDYLFVLARHTNRLTKHPETIWKQ